MLQPGLNEHRKPGPIGPLRAQDALACNDGHGFFEALGDAVVTGPTMTNVNDFRAILIAPDLEQLP